MICFYSGCGNSRWVAQQLAAHLEDKMIFIPDALRSRQRITLHEREALGLVFPIYAWDVPTVVRQFVKQCLDVEAGAEVYVYVACTCGDDAGLAVQRLSKLLKRQGLKVSADFGFVMPETYINLPGFTLDTSEGERQKLQHAEALMPEVVDAVRRRASTSLTPRGKQAWLKSYVVSALFNALLISDRPFRVEEQCVGCGRCAEVCPAQNVVMSEGKGATRRPQWQHHCWGCMACYHHCPVQAIQRGRHTLGKGQYYYGHTR
ncbi:MAG: EFR1 family ferrodoxin [Bacteroidales bacterium]|nr:EFR1 family ferrodoxin [Bacteroidales bacterium]